MTELLHDTPSPAMAAPAAPVAAAPDVIDQLAGIVPGSWLDRLRRSRPVTRAQAQASHEALFQPAAPVVGQVAPAERHAVAAFVAALHRQPRVADFHLQKVQALAPDWAEAVLQAAALGQTEGPYGSFPAGPLAVESRAGLVFALPAALQERLGVRLQAALRHAHALVLHPRDAQVPWVHALEAAGWSADDTVVLSQIVAFLSFQLRVVAGLQVLDAGWDSGAPALVRATAPQAESPAPVAATPGTAPVAFTQAELDWLPWVAPLDEAALTPRHHAGLVDASRAKSAYFRLLARDPDTLGARTRTDKDIFYNSDAGPPRAERELAAAAASRHNGCIYCASVHARFASHFSHRTDDVQRLLDQGVGAELGPRWNAIVDASVALTDTPPRLGTGHVTALRAQGLDAQAAADLVHAAAFFNWANRLMLTLGEPVFPPAD